MILPGAQIGNNVIIGGGSVVHGIIPDNTVWAGNPAKMISSLEEYKTKRMEKYESSAVLFASQIINKLNRRPTIEEMRMYISLFLPRTPENMHYFNDLPTGLLPNTAENIMNMEKKYSDFVHFLRANNLI